MNINTTTLHIPTEVLAHGCSEVRAKKIMRSLSPAAQQETLSCLAARLRAGLQGEAKPITNVPAYLRWLVHLQLRHEALGHELIQG